MVKNTFQRLALCCWIKGQTQHRVCSLFHVIMEMANLWNIVVFMSLDDGKCPLCVLVKAPLSQAFTLTLELRFVLCYRLNEVF